MGDNKSNNKNDNKNGNKSDKRREQIDKKKMTYQIWQSTTSIGAMHRMGVETSSENCVRWLFGWM